MAPKHLQPKVNERTNPSGNRQSPTPAKPQITSDAAELLQLQRSAGNRAVVRLLDRRGSDQPAPPASGERLARIQAKLTVGPAGDAYERQADAMAEVVMRQAAVATPPAQPQLLEEDKQARRQPVAQLEMEEEDEEVQSEEQAGGPQAEAQTAEPQPVAQVVEPQPVAQAVEPQPEAQPVALESQEVEGEGQVDEDQEKIQRMPAAAEGGFEVGGDFEARLEARRGDGSPLPASTRARVEPHFGADFSPVRVHTDAEAGRLSRSVSAQAFTHGTDIYMGADKYNPASAAGQRLLAHELTHVVQQAGAAVQRKPAANLQAQATRRLARMAQRSFDIQREFQPVTTTAASHLRPRIATGVDFDTYLGRKIPSGEEIVVDLAQTVTQRRQIISNVTWARAVDVRPTAWNPALDPLSGGYIRFNKARPQADVHTVSVAMPNRADVRATRRFHEDVGEYADVEESISRAGNRIIRVGNTFKSMPADHQAVPLDDREKMQTGSTEAIRAKLGLMLNQVALAKHIDPAFLATPDIIGKLAKPLRAGAGTMDRTQIERWTDWSGSVFTRIRLGVQQLCDALNHWKAWLDTGGVGGVVLTELQLFGSDLHERGIGAVRVKFTKPANTHPMFPGTVVEAVIKQDDREVEKSLLGAQPGSLANQLNQQFAVAAGDANLLPTIKMETHATHGAFIEFVRGTAAEHYKGDQAVTPSMTEAISFSMITGLGDLHKENILWDHGKPYLIDADNVMLNRLITPPVDAQTRNATVPQSGFTRYNKDTRETTLQLHDDPRGSTSLIIQEMLHNAPPLLAAVKAALQNRKGRIVPLRTMKWASWLNAYPRFPEGNATDDRAAESKHGLAAKGAHLLPNPNPGGAINLDFGPGLEGETGVATGGRHYADVAAKTQIKADFDRGQIPFYNYDLSTGHVLHNNQVIWHGQTVDDAMAVLLARFPVPAPVVH